MRQALALFVAIAAVSTFVSFSANAMPASSLQSVTSSDQQVQTVAGGCGRGWHRGPHGHCRRN